MLKYIAGEDMRRGDFVRIDRQTGLLMKAISGESFLGPLPVLKPVIKGGVIELPEQE